MKQFLAGIAWLIATLVCALAAEPVTVMTWNLQWFPGVKPNPSSDERLAHMGAAKDVLLNIHADILCLQEVRDWDSVAELVSVLPNFQPLVVSRFRERNELSRQQVAIASAMPAEAAWSEPFRPSPATPPRGFSFAAFRRGRAVLLLYSVHFKSNLGDLHSDIAKREEAARQLLDHAAAMDRLYSRGAKVVTVIAGDFNTDPTDPRFASEQTFNMFRAAGFVWSWENVPTAQRVTVPANGQYPDACFDGFLVRGAEIVSCRVIPIPGVSDHAPVEIILHDGAPGER